MEFARKKFSVSSILCVVLVALLLLSFSLGLSSAWFTASDSDSTHSNLNLKFGTVDLENKTLVVNAPQYLLPSQNITFDPINYTGNVNAYYRIYFGVTNYSGSEPALSELQSTLKTSTVQYGLFSVDNSTTQVTPNPINIASSTGNKFQNVSCTLTVTIEVIQQANLTGVADPDNPTDAELNSVFDRYYK